jgi:hypothetical protein
VIEFHILEGFSPSASEKRVVTWPAHSISHKSGESALTLEGLLKNNLNFVQDVSIIYVNFNITKFVFFEKKNWRDYFHSTPHSNHIFWHTHSLAPVKENRSHTIKAMLPTNQAQQ